MSNVDFLSYAGPGDRMMPSSEVKGYQPVSRIGEIVSNAFVDVYEWQKLPEVLTRGDAGIGVQGVENFGGDATYEHRPHFFEWSTVQPGMVCVSRKKRTAVFRQYVAAEAAAPVIACAACKTTADEREYFFAGIARSKSVREMDDGLGPKTDEFFTLSLGGMATVLNTSETTLFPGDLVEWCFKDQREAAKTPKRLKAGPRRIGIKAASVSSPKIIGRALSLAKPGEPLDLLIKQ